MHVGIHINLLDSTARNNAAPFSFLDLLSVTGKTPKFIVNSKAMLDFKTLCKVRFDYRRTAKQLPLEPDDMSELMASTSSSKEKHRPTKKENHVRTPITSRLPRAQLGHRVGPGITLVD